MKKGIGIVLALVLVVAAVFSGCSAGSTTTAQASSGNKFAGDPNKEFYMVTFLSGYPFWKDCYRGFEEAGKLYGVKTVYGGSTEYDVNKAVTELDQIIAKKPAGIAVTCMDANAYIPSINNAIKQGIPVVTFDSDSPKSNRIAYIGTQNYNAGAAAARFIGEQLGGKGSVAAVTSLGQSNIKERTDGFQETLAAEYPNIKVVQVVDGGTDQVKAATNVSNLLKANSDINYMFCALQTAIIGAQTALDEAGLTGKVKIVGFDTDQTTLDSIKQGKVEATISQSPWCEGYWSMNYLYFIEAGLISSTDNWLAKGYPSIPQTADSGSMVVTKDNESMFETSSSASPSAAASAAASAS